MLHSLKFHASRSLFRPTPRSRRRLARGDHLFACARLLLRFQSSPRGSPNLYPSRSRACSSPRAAGACAPPRRRSGARRRRSDTRRARGRGSRRIGMASVARLRQFVVEPARRHALAHGEQVLDEGGVVGIEMTPVERPPSGSRRGRTCSASSGASPCRSTARASCRPRRADEQLVARPQGDLPVVVARVLVGDARAPAVRGDERASPRASCARRAASWACPATACRARPRSGSHPRRRSRRPPRPASTRFASSPDLREYVLASRLRRQHQRLGANACADS